MTVAYLVLAHKNPSQLARLADALGAGGGRVLVHVDAKTDDAPFRAALAGRPGVAFAAGRHAVHWGGFGMVRATLELCRAALAGDAERLVLLSGLDLPLRPVGEIESVLAADVDRIDLLRLPHAGLGDGGGLDRIRWLHAVDTMARLRLHPKALALAHARLLPFSPRRLPDGLTLRMGSQWWALRRGTVERILALLAARPEIERFFAGTRIPDESFFQTLVATVVPEAAVAPPLRYMDWSRPMRPWVFRLDDLPALHGCGALFARKFDVDVDARVVDAVLALQR